MIDSVRQTVLSILNKNNYGYVSPSDFNLFAKQAQLEIFEGYFNELNKAINAENARMSGTDYANMTKGLNEDIDVFSVSKPLDFESGNRFFTPSIATTGDDYYLLNKVLVLNSEAEPVTHSRITMLANSNLTAPSAQYPAYTIDNPAAGQVITLYPTGTTYAQGDVQCQYVRYPSTRSGRTSRWLTESLYSISRLLTTKTLRYPSMMRPGWYIRYCRWLA